MAKSSLITFKKNIPDINIDKNINLEPLKSNHAEFLQKWYLDKENVKYMSNLIINWNKDLEGAKNTIKKINE